MTAALLAQMNNKTSFDSNSEYLEAYVDLIYLRAVVGGMISFAEQTSFQDLLESGKRRHNDYEIDLWCEDYESGVFDDLKIESHDIYFDEVLRSCYHKLIDKLDVVSDLMYDEWEQTYKNH